ncbi:hypothetical protein J6590_063842 [Homalodisca vitripennis]|nr:hypothetical protein J6590_063842 [Homalodisca vitripennis]
MVRTSTSAREGEKDCKTKSDRTKQKTGEIERERPKVEQWAQAQSVKESEACRSGNYTASIVIVIVDLPVTGELRHEQDVPDRLSICSRLSKVVCNSVLQQCQALSDRHTSLQRHAVMEAVESDREMLWAVSYCAEKSLAKPFSSCFSYASLSLGLRPVDK